MKRDRATRLEWVKPPQQARSQQTLDRILRATEELLGEKSIDAISVAEIAKRAGSSVGAFYARFPDKEALFHSLFQRFYEEGTATIDAALSPDRWADVPFDKVLETAISFLVQVFRERRGVLAAFSLSASRQSGMGNYAQSLGGRAAEAVVTLLHARPELVAHERPTEAARILVWLLLSALQARCFYSVEQADMIPDALIVGELTRLCIAYLGIHSH